MGVAVILVMWPRARKQTFLPLSLAGSAWKLASIGPVGLKEKFENVDAHTTRACLYYKLTNDTLAQVN